MKPRYRIRRAKPRDTQVMADILAGWIAETDWFTTTAPASASRAAMAGLVAQGRVWVATAGWLGRVQGFIALEGDAVAGLYLRPGARGQGLGRALLRHAQAASGVDLHLASFQANVGANAFYRAMGCEETGRSAGGNEEGLPDIRFRLPLTEMRTRA